MFGRYAITILCALLMGTITLAGVQTLRLAWLQSSVAEGVAEALDASRTKEAAWQSTLSKVRDEKDAKIESIAAARDAALAGLRDRRPRLPPSATAAGQCDGASGRELSREDAEFLVQFAAERDAAAAQLAACQGWIKATQ